MMPLTRSSLGLKWHVRPSTLVSVGLFSSSLLPSNPADFQCNVYFLTPCMKQYPAADAYSLNSVISPTARFNTERRALDQIDCRKDDKGLNIFTRLVLF
jgi:hypothetical protein